MPPRQQQSPAQAGRIRCHQWRRCVSDSEWKLPTQGIASPPTAARCAAATAARNDRGRWQFARRGRDSGSQGQRDRWQCARRLRHSEVTAGRSAAIPRAGSNLPLRRAQCLSGMACLNNVPRSSRQAVAALDLNERGSYETSRLYPQSQTRTH